MKFRANPAKKNSQVAVLPKDTQAVGAFCGT